MSSGAIENKGQVATDPAVDKRSVMILVVAECVMMLCYALFTEYGGEAKPNADGVTPTSNATNSLHDFYPFYQDVHVMIFVGFGFLMTFMKKYAFSAVGYNFLLAAMAIQWSILCSSFFERIISDAPGDHWADKIQIDITSLIGGDFAAGAVLISFGAVLGKASLDQLCMMVFLEIIFFSINEKIGVLTLKAVDVGGSMFVHTFGAYFGLAVSMRISKRGKWEKAGDLFGSVYNSDLFAMVGTLFLWMFWPSFNGALASGSNQHRVIVNTVLSLTNSCIGALLASKYLQEGHKLSMVDIQNATLAGGVAIGSSADMLVNPHGALIVGFIAGFLSVVGYVKITPYLEDKIGLHDTCGVHNLHGMPGLMGGLTGAIATMMVTAADYKAEQFTIFGAGMGPKMEMPDGSNAGGEGRKAGEQGIFQIIALLVTVVIAIASGLLTGEIMDRGLPSAPLYGLDGLYWLDVHYVDTEDTHFLQHHDKNQDVENNEHNSEMIAVKVEVK